MDPLCAIFCVLLLAVIWLEAFYVILKMVLKDRVLFFSLWEELDSNFLTIELSKQKHSFGSLLLILKWVSRFVYYNFMSIGLLFQKALDTTKVSLDLLLKFTINLSSFFFRWRFWFIFCIANGSQEALKTAIDYVQRVSVFGADPRRKLEVPGKIKMKSELILGGFSSFRSTLHIYSLSKALRMNFL